MSRYYGLGGPSLAQRAAVSDEIKELEEAHGVDLDDDAFDYVGRLSEEVGVERAFKLTLRAHDAAEAAWESKFDEQVSAFEKELGRKVAPTEKEKVRARLEDSDEFAEPNFRDGWEHLYGKRYSAEQVEAIEAEHRQAIEKLRAEGHSDEFLAKYDQEKRPGLDEKKAAMSRSGLGQYDLDVAEERTAWMAEMMAEALPAVEKPADDSTDAERVQYMTARMQGAPAADASEEG